MNILLTEIIKAVIIILVIVAMRYFIPWIKPIIEKSKYKWVADLAYQGVRYAEQTILGDKTGAQKKAIVIAFIKKILLAKKISISDDLIDAAIEAAVYGMNQAKAGDQ